MSDEGRGSELKSAYEAALERLESRGIERPREGALSPETLAQIEDARRKATARLAEIQILHRDRLKTLRDPEARREAEREYAIDRERIEAERERTLARLRGA